MSAKRATRAGLAVALLFFLLPRVIRSAEQAHLPGSAASESGAAQTGNLAALVVQFGDGSYATRCVSFSEDSIGGLDLLRRSGLQVNLWGGAVCRIEDEGCDFPVQPCFCQCKGSSCQYWSYWHWRDAKWTYSQTGSGDYQVHNGDIEAWLWGTAQKPPVAVSFAEICGASAATVPAPDKTRIPSAHPPSQGASPGQYAIFLIMAVILLVAFWWRRGRERV